MMSKINKNIPEALIKNVAYKVWCKQKEKSINRSPDKDWGVAERYLRKKKLIIFKWQIKNLSIKILKISIKPFISIEKRIVEPIAYWLDEWDLFRIFEKIGILIAIIIFIIEVSDRAEQRIFEAWQVVKDGKGSQSGVVRIAIERLHKEGFSLSGIDAEGTNLRRINISNANIEGANFVGADLSNAKLWNTNLSRAKLRSANLIFTKLACANLRDAKVMNANLAFTNLSSADLRNADLSNTQLIFANLSYTKIGGTNFSNAYLGGANLIGAKGMYTTVAREIKTTNFRSTDLRDANLRNANLWGANLENANLGNANLIHTNLRYAYLKDTNLKNTKFWDKNSGETKNITPEQIKTAKNWDKAIYSPEFRKKLGLPPEN